MKKRFFTILPVILLVIILIFVLEGFRYWMNPLTKPNDEMETSILLQIPLGSSIDEVIHFIESKRRWKVDWVNHNNGYTNSHENPRKVIGVQSVGAFIGYYYSFNNYYFRTDVVVYFAFDKESKLIDIGVSKYTDSL
ncbi:hypothetical protein [Paenibacillus daejeonensis]|uniref:hypothetical protein n=1 Tax=Paenibacillus daejeonensis TaxID=135193 RepID=UPI00037BF9B9|nr:hypothetical protein [Paenibacillus daejeonensis]